MNRIYNELHNFKFDVKSSNKKSAMDSYRVGHESFNINEF